MIRIKDTICHLRHKYGRERFGAEAMSRIFHFTPRVLSTKLPIEVQIEVRQNQREDLLETRAEIDDEIKKVDAEIADLQRKLPTAA